jgi:flavin-dependent dehydrogenase
VRDRSHRNFGFKRHYRAVAAPNSIDLYSFRRGYLGVNRVEDGITNICGLVHATRLKGHKGRWDSFIDVIRREEPRLETLYASHEPAQEGYLSSEPVIFRARSAVEGGVFMVGDASGVLDPLTGNGMAMAVQSALLAAPLLLRLLADHAQRVAIEAEYRHRHHEFFASRIAWSRKAAVLLSRPRLLDAALAAVRTPRLGELFLRRTRGSRDEVAQLADDFFS